MFPLELKNSDLYIDLFLFELRKIFTYLSIVNGSPFFHQLFFNQFNSNNLSLWVFIIDFENEIKHHACHHPYFHQNIQQQNQQYFKKEVVWANHCKLHNVSLAYRLHHDLFFYLISPNNSKEILFEPCQVMHKSTSGLVTCWLQNILLSLLALKELIIFIVIPLVYMFLA